MSGVTVARTWRFATIRGGGERVCATIALEAASVDLEGEPVRAATPRMLYVMKRDTLRPLDHADAAALRRAFDLEDE